MLIAANGGANIVVVSRGQVLRLRSGLERRNEQVGLAVRADRRAEDLAYQGHPGTAGIERQRARSAIDAGDLRDIAALRGRDVEVRIGWRVISLRLAHR